jgi:hypothetical protein
MNRTKRKQIKLLLKRITKEEVKVKRTKTKKELERKRLNDLVEADVFARFFFNLMKETLKNFDER